jgi:hypothetical protein
VECEKLFTEIRLTTEEQRSVELATRNQSEFEEWEQQRSGRITGTKIRRILKSPSIENLYVSIIAHDFRADYSSGSATKWLDE